MVRLGRHWSWDATGCLYHRDPGRRDEWRGATWTHQQSLVRRVTTSPDHPIVKVHRVSVANSAAFPAIHPGDLGKTRAASAVTISAIRAGETRSSESTALAPRIFCRKAFLWRPTPAPPPFLRPSWRGSRIASCSVPSVTPDGTSGPMANSSMMDPSCLQERARPLSDPGRSRLQWT